jgi:hypothetical protein
MTFEEQLKDYLENTFDPGTKNWNDYEAAKYTCLFLLSPTDEQYPIMLKIITDWLEL